MSRPVIAIVGRPNVGKSSLFNAIAGQRISIVDNVPGVTRDRVYADCEWFNRHFLLMDTGGLDTQGREEMSGLIRQQVDLGLELADVLILVTNLQDGVTLSDQEVAAYLRTANKPLILAVNKCDQVGDMPLAAYDFYNLGLGEPYCISASHKLGLSDLVSAALDLVEELPAAPVEEDRIQVAFVGKPNVGKSSLLNQILQEERAIVSERPGTTRDALQVDIDLPEGHYTLVDTAGLRRRNKVDSALEKYSNLRTQRSIEQADVCLLMLDQSEGLTGQDKKIAGLIHDAGKAAIIVLNKWDLVEDKAKRLEELTLDIRNQCSFLSYAGIFTLSALSGQGLHALLEEINLVYEEAGRRYSTSVINEVLRESVALHRPPSYKGKTLKIFYASQVAVRPPTLLLFVNDKELLHFSYERYIENRFRQAFGFHGSPLRLRWRARPREDMMFRQSGKSKQ